MILNRFFLINVFTGPNARGNQACVLFVDDLSDDDYLLRVAADFNLPATTFLKQESKNTFSVRWFAPMAEIGLCGHGTLAATWATHQLFPEVSEFSFNYQSGSLKGRVTGDSVELEGDAILSTEVDIPAHAQKGFHNKAIGYFTTSNKDVVLFENESDIKSMKPNWDALRASSTFGYVITARSASYDFVSRVLLPHLSFLEDQATGSAHLVLTPFWSERLNKSTMEAFQASERGGEVECSINGDLVALKTNCTIFGEGIFVRFIN